MGGRCLGGVSGGYGEGLGGGETHRGGSRGMRGSVAF